MALNSQTSETNHDQRNHAPTTGGLPEGLPGLFSAVLVQATKDAIFEASKMTDHGAAVRIAAFEDWLRSDDGHCVMILAGFAPCERIVQRLVDFARTETERKRRDPHAIVLFRHSKMVA